MSLRSVARHQRLHDGPVAQSPPGSTSRAPRHSWRDDQTRYRILHWPACDVALRERRSLTVWFDPYRTWKAAPSGRRGRQQVFFDVAIQERRTIEVLFGLPLRPATGFVASLLRLAGLDSPVPDYSTLFRRQRRLKVLLPYRAARGPLDLLVPFRDITA